MFPIKSLQPEEFPFEKPEFGNSEHLKFLDEAKKKEERIKKIEKNIRNGKYTKAYSKVECPNCNESATTFSRLTIDYKGEKLCFNCGEVLVTSY